jgi:hypothetical protein
MAVVQFGLRGDGDVLVGGAEEGGIGGEAPGVREDDGERGGEDVEVAGRKERVCGSCEL